MAYNGFESSEEALKVKYRPLLLACQAALRSIPAGAADMFRVLDRNVHGSLGQFNPADYAHAPSLLLFLDVLEYIADCVMAGMARSGEVYKLEISPGLLMEAFTNTVELLKSNVVVAGEVREEYQS